MISAESATERFFAISELVSLTVDMIAASNRKDLFNLIGINSNWLNFIAPRIWTIPARDIESCISLHLLLKVCKCRKRARIYTRYCRDIKIEPCKLYTDGHTLKEFCHFKCLHEVYLVSDFEIATSYPKRLIDRICQDFADYVPDTLRDIHVKGNAAYEIAGKVVELMGPRTTRVCLHTYHPSCQNQLKPHYTFVIRALSHGVFDHIGVNLTRLGLKYTPELVEFSTLGEVSQLIAKSPTLKSCQLLYPCLPELDEIVPQPVNHVNELVTKLVVLGNISIWGELICSLKALEKLYVNNCNATDDLFNRLRFNPLVKVSELHIALNRYPSNLINLLAHTPSLEAFYLTGLHSTETMVGEPDVFSTVAGLGAQLRRIHTDYLCPQFSELITLGLGCRQLEWLKFGDRDPEPNYDSNWTPSLTPGYSITSVPILDNDFWVLSSPVVKANGLFPALKGLSSEIVIDYRGLVDNSPSPRQCAYSTIGDILFPAIKQNLCMLCRINETIPTPRSERLQVTST